MLSKSITEGREESAELNWIIHLTIPSYEEISVKNLFDDAINTPILKDYLPSSEMLSNRLPERDFFFGILATLKQDYLKLIIKDAHEVRMKPEEDREEKSGILLSDTWLEELKKYPFLSSKVFILNSFREKGNWYIPDERKSSSY